VKASEIRPVGANNRWQPMLSEAENMQTGHRTSIRFDSFKADQNVPASLFSPKELENK
jgi:outer membrane lipoprotein-sorting protein